MASSFPSVPLRPSFGFTGAPPAQIGGPCALCGEVHTLDHDARPALQALALWFDAITTPATVADRAFVALLEKASGRKMVATLVGRDPAGEVVTLRAFSGDLAGVGDVEGCVPSIIRREDTAALEAALEQKLIANAVIPRSEAERRALWDIRENFEALYKTKPVFLYDVSLPIRQMDAYIKDVRARLARRWPKGFCHVLGHLGDGNLHLFVHPDAEGDHLHSQSDDDVYTPLGPIGGSVSAEHGIGAEKVSRLPISRTPAEIDLMRTLKRTLDPKNLLNRGKVIEV